MVAERRLRAARQLCDELLQSSALTLSGTVCRLPQAFCAAIQCNCRAMSMASAKSPKPRACSAIGDDHDHSHCGAHAGKSFYQLRCPTALGTVLARKAKSPSAAMSDQAGAQLRSKTTMSIQPRALRAKRVILAEHQLVPTSSHGIRSARLRSVPLS